MQVQHTKSLRPTQAADFLGISVPALWKLLKNKLAPPPPRSWKLSPRCTVFDLAALITWRDSRPRPSRYRPGRGSGARAGRGPVPAVRGIERNAPPPLGRSPFWASIAATMAAKWRDPAPLRAREGLSPR